MIRVARAALRLALGTLVFVAVFAVAATWLPPLVGYEVMPVRSGSMQPAIPLGAASIVRITPATEIAVGDVVAFYLPNGAAVIHRVLAVSGADDTDMAFDTKGDANTHRDAWAVPPEAVIGEVVGSVPAFGFVIGLLGIPIGAVTLLSIAGALLTALWLLDELEVTDTSARPVVT